MNTRTRFDRQLENLSTSLIHLGALTCAFVDRCIQSFLWGDAALAQAALGENSSLHQLKEAIDAQCMRLLVQQQPVAADLRRISASYQFADGIDQLRYWAFMVAETALVLEGGVPSKLKGIQKMADNVSTIVADSITVNVEQDLGRIEDVILLRQNVESAFLSNQAALVAYVEGNPFQIRAGMEIQLALKYLERMSYHAVDVAGNIYILHGQNNP